MGTNDEGKPIVSWSSLIFFFGENAPSLLYAHLFKFSVSLNLIDILSHPNTMMIK